MRYLKLTAVVVLAVIALSGAQCFAFSEDGRACTRQSIIELVVWAAEVALIAVSTWLGMEATKASGKVWLGWLVGILVFIAFSAAQFYLDLPIPKTSVSEDGDNSYRR